MRITRTRETKAVIPTASMADIAFLLIIFFMVTTVHDVDRTSVNLPLAKIRIEAEKGAAIVVMAKDKDKNDDLIYMFSDGEAMSTLVGGPEDIYLEASRLTYSDSTKQFVLKADGEIHFEKVDELLDQMRRGGVQNVLLLTQQKVKRSGE
jgi:biopolymer transport protein ExbD